MKMIATTVLAAGLVSASASGQVLFDFESGLQGWGISGFGNGTEFVNPSATGATQGSAGALAMGHDGGNFSWDASWVIDGNDPNYLTDPVVLALMAAAADPAGKTLELDLTYVGADLAVEAATFVNVSVSLQSDAGFKQVDGLAEVSAPFTDQTIHLSLPLDSGNLAGTDPNSGFYRFTIGLNTTAGRGLSTVYLDNIAIVPEPASLGLVALGGLAIAGRRRRR